MQSGVMRQVRCWAEVAVCFAVLLAMPGCANEPRSRATNATALQGSVRGLAIGYSLLFDLVDDEQGVDEILSIKSVSKPTEAIIRRIARVSAQAASELNSLKNLTPSLQLDDVELPLVEKATRKSIAVKTAMDLLVSLDSFEVRLLLTQAQALRYGAYLALELKSLDSNRKRRHWLESFSKTCGELYDQVVARLRVAK
ncbi:MAG: hypothetical protein AB7D07_12965 [Desulfovibrionaceae bacterium]